MPLPAILPPGFHCDAHRSHRNHRNDSKRGPSLPLRTQFTQGSKQRFLHLNEDGLLSCAKRVSRLQESVNDDGLFDLVTETSLERQLRTAANGAWSGDRAGLVSVEVRASSPAPSIPGSAVSPSSRLRQSFSPNSSRMAIPVYQLRTRLADRCPKTSERLGEPCRLSASGMPTLYLLALERQSARPPFRAHAALFTGYFGPTAPRLSHPRVY